MCTKHRKSERDYIDSRLIKFIIYPKCFFKEHNKTTDKAKKVSNFVIKNNKNEMLRNDIDLGETFNEKFVSINYTIAASVEKFPITTDGIEVSEKTVFYSAHWSDFSEFIEYPKNHKSPGLDEMRAKILKVSLM